MTWAHRSSGLSVDSPYANARFAEECDAFPFLSDFNRTASRAFDALRPSLGELEGVSERAAFLIDGDGTITYSWVGEHPGVFPPLEEIKRAVADARWFRVSGLGSRVSGFGSRVSGFWSRVGYTEGISRMTGEAWRGD